MAVTTKTHTIYITQREDTDEGEPTVSNVVPVQSYAPYICEVFKVYIPSVDRNTGEEITIPNTIRRLFLTDPLAIGCSGFYRVTCQVRRSKQNTAILTHSVSVVPWEEQPWYTNPDGLTEAWYIIDNCFGPSKERRQMTTPQILEWLTGRLGAEDAEAALAELQQDVCDGMDMPVRRKKQPKAAGTKSARNADQPKCKCGRPVWSVSHTGQCFPCTPIQIAKASASPLQ